MILKPDKDYIKDRDSLIPEAVHFANKYCGKDFKGDDVKDRDAWNG